MNFPSPDPARFKPFHESLAVTLRRTITIAIIVASVITLIRPHHLPTLFARWREWFSLAVFVGWISVGGHWVELIFLNGLRPRIAHWSDLSLAAVRIGAWFIGGTILFIAAAISRSLIATGQLPDQTQVTHALVYGGLAFVGIELCVHLVMLVMRKPCFWNLK